MAQFPTVPNAPGVPQLNRQPGLSAPAPSLLSQDNVSDYGETPAPKWGLFLDGNAVVQADTVVSMEFKRDWAVPDYPLEKGAFETYNKVQIPFDVRVRFASGGDLPKRQLLITSVENAAASLDLYDVVTPEKIYQNVNIVHHDYARAADRGLGMIVMDVWLVEIRVNATLQFTQTQAPAGAGTTNDGSVQPTDATPAQTTAVQSQAAVGGGGGW